MTRAEIHDRFSAIRARAIARADREDGEHIAALRRPPRVPRPVARPPRVPLVRRQSLTVSPARSPRRPRR